MLRHLKLTLSGADKLPNRAASSGLLLEVSGRRAWRVYAVPDLAVTLRFVGPPIRRPRTRPASDMLGAKSSFILNDVDRAITEIDARFPFINDARQRGGRSPLD